MIEYSVALFRQKMKEALDQAYDGDPVVINRTIDGKLQRFLVRPVETSIITPPPTQPQQASPAPYRDKRFPNAAPIGTGNNNPSIMEPLAPDELRYEPVEPNA
jgi:hypothetical protein